MRLDIPRAIIALTLLQGCVGPVPSYYYASAGPRYYGAPFRQVAAARAPGGYRTAGSYPLEPLHGAWTGTADCGGESRPMALFAFNPRPLPRSVAIMGPMTPEGRAIVEVRGSTNPSTGEIQINPGQQIKPAPGYRPVAWSGSIQPDGSFAGRMLGGDCGSLRLTRLMGADDPRFLDAERNTGEFRKELLGSEFRTAVLTQPQMLRDRVLGGVGVCILYSVCPAPNVLGGSSMTLRRDRGSEPFPSTMPRVEMMGPNDWDGVPTIDPPQIVSPQIVAPTIGEH